MPAKRVWLSRVGNRRHPRVHVERGHDEHRDDARLPPRGDHLLAAFGDGKEFHLEVILKATRVRPAHPRDSGAVLEWKDYKHQGQRVKRKSSSRVNRLIVSHSLFSMFANPVRYVWGASLASFALGVIFFINAVVLYALKMVSAYTALLSMALFIVAIVLFVLGVVVKQGNMIQREL